MKICTYGNSCMFHTKSQKPVKIANSENKWKFKTSKSKHARHHKTSKIIFTLYHYNTDSSACISYECVVFNFCFYCKSLYYNTQTYWNFPMSCPRSSSGVNICSHSYILQNILLNNRTFAVPVSEWTACSYCCDTALLH